MTSSPRRATERLLVTEAAGDPEALTTSAPIVRAAAAIRAGRLVAFPTETVYGLGARADDEAAVRGIFEAKGRPASNPLIVHVPDTPRASALAGAWPEGAAVLAAAFWPGPLTLVVPAPANGIAASVLAGGATLALRTPQHPVARALLLAAGVPIAAPSANRSTRISPTTADHVMKGLDGRIDVCLDGGATGFGIESTIVDVTTHPATLLRAGAIEATAIASLVAVVDRCGRVVSPDDVARAPGGFARHYAPRAQVLLLPRSALGASASEAASRGARFGALVRGFFEGRVPSLSGATRIEILADDASGYASGLYAALHRLEDAGCDMILIDEVPDDAVWDAVRDRLRRAAAGR